jgi:hypothetical protein
MAKGSATAVTPEQAKWILERLMAAKKVSSEDVRGAVADMQSEIADIERRLASLREATGNQQTSSAATIVGPAPRRRKRRGGGKKGHPRGIAGTLAVLLRSIPAAEHAAIAAIRGEQGIKAAIKAAQNAVKKR